MKNLLGFIKENKKTIRIKARTIASLIVAKKKKKKINNKIEKVDKEYEEMNEVIETTHEMNLPEYSEEDYNNDKRINTTKKVVKKIGLVISRICVSSILPILMILDNCYAQHQLTLEGEPKEGEMPANALMLLPASVLWYFMYKAMSV